MNTVKLKKTSYEETPAVITRQGIVAKRTSALLLNGHKNTGSLD
jgi:hypothetical protein